MIRAIKLLKDCRGNNMNRRFETYRILLFVIVACLCTFFLWASTTQIDQQVRGTGRIITSGKIRTIQHLENGIVKEILVQEGKSVKAGDTLFQLTNTRAESEMKEIAVASSALLVKQKRLQAERDGKTKFRLNNEGNKNSDNIIRAETNIFDARKSELEEKLDGFKKRMKQKVLKLDELESTITNLKKERGVSKEQLSIKKKLYSSGAVSRSQYLEADSTVKNFDTRISKTRKEIPITKSEISEIANLLEETKQNWRSKVVEELNTVNVDINKLRERIVTFSDAVSRTAIQAPINGIINKLHVNTIGGVIQSGQTLVEIIPVEEKLVVEGQIATENRGKIWLGLPVAANITAYDYSIYGSLKGELTYISADSFSDNQGNNYYQIRVTLDNAALSEDMPVVPGMTVDLNILASKISVMRALFKPLDQIRENALREL